MSHQSCYYVTRKFAFLNSHILATVAGPENCSPYVYFMSSFYSLSAISTALFSFLQARAIYHGENAITILLFVAWACVAVQYGLIPFTHLGSTGKLEAESCLVMDMKHFADGTLITRVLYDTAIFGLLCHRMILISSEHSHPNVKDRYKVFFGSVQASFTSQTLLRGSQRYYL